MRITLIGDICLDGLFYLEPEKNLNRMQSLFPYFQESDFVFANLESPLEGNGEVNENKDRLLIQYSSERVFTEILPKLNLTALSLANNHIYDCKTSGIENTLTCLKQLNIQFTGAGLSHEHIEPMFIKHNGYKIGFLSYVDENTNPQIDSSAKIFINYYDEEKVISDICATKPKCDFLIVSLHWGIDYSFYPTKYQSDVSKKFIDAGANIIMGHHTHTLQPFERYKNGIIFYSLGSFCHGDYYQHGKLRSLPLKTKESVIAHVNIKNLEIDIVPIITKKYNFMHPHKANMESINRRKLFVARWIQKNELVRQIVLFKELIFDKIMDYFFGYYKNPISQLLSFSYLKKLKYFIDDIQWKVSRTT